MTKDSNDERQNDFVKKYCNRQEYDTMVDGIASWYLQGSVEYHFFQTALTSWIKRTAVNCDDYDPDRSWRWPVEYLADSILDLFPNR